MAAYNHIAFLCKLLEMLDIKVYLRNCQRRAPLLLENIQTNASVTVDVGMEDLCAKRNLCSQQIIRDLPIRIVDSEIIPYRYAEAEMRTQIHAIRAIVSACSARSAIISRHIFRTTPWVYKRIRHLRLMESVRHSSVRE